MPPAARARVANPSSRAIALRLPLVFANARILEIELFFMETSLRSESSCVVSGIWRIGSKVGCLANGWELERAESSQRPAPNRTPSETRFRLLLHRRYG